MSGAEAPAARPGPGAAAAVPSAARGGLAFLRAFLPACIAAFRAAARRDPAPAAAAGAPAPRAPSSRRGGRPAAALRAGAGLALLLLAAMAALPSPAQAQNLMVSNTDGAFTNSLSNIFAQSFRTGRHTTGYILHSVGIRLAGGENQTYTGSNYRVRILSDSSGSPGTTVVATLTSPSSVKSGSVNVFTAPANSPLNANTTYWVEAAQTDGTGGLPDYQVTFSDTENGQANWSIGNFRSSKTNASDSWESSTAVAQIQINGFAVNSAGDYTPPTRITGPQVQPNGTEISTGFSETIDGTNLPPADAFTVTARGRPVTVTGVRRHPEAAFSHVLRINVSPTIRTGQTVNVQYADPTAGDDANAIQDVNGNDAASFTHNGVSNISTQALEAPDAPTGLTASTSGSTVTLSWTAPLYDGGSAIAGYRIERADPGSSTWSTEVANTGNTDTARDVTLPSGVESRQYRVSAINAQGTGDPSAAAIGGNDPATGAPEISGSGRVGQTLSAAVPGGIADGNGLPASASDYALQWLRIADGGTETEISGETGTSYMPVAADAGTRVRLRVRFTDGNGYDEEAFSAAVAIRMAMPPATCPAFSLPSGRERVWQSVLTVAEITGFGGMARGHGFVGARGQGSLSVTNFEIGSRTFRVNQVESRNEGQLVFSHENAMLTASQEANLQLHICGETYALADANANAGTYTWPAAGLDWSGLVGMTRTLRLTIRNTAPTGLPLVSGTAQAGSTVTARAGRAAVGDADGQEFNRRRRGLQQRRRAQWLRQYQRAHRQRLRDRLDHLHDQRAGRKQRDDQDRFRRRPERCRRGRPQPRADGGRQDQHAEVQRRHDRLHQPVPMEQLRPVLVGRRHGHGEDRQRSARHHAAEA